MSSNKQDYYPMNSFQKLVYNVPEKQKRKEKKKHKGEGKVETPSLSTIVDIQTSPDFAPDKC